MSDPVVPYIWPANKTNVPSDQLNYDFEILRKYIADRNNGTIGWDNFKAIGPQPWTDVTAHSVVGDGTTNDTTAINAVFSSAAANSVIFFPPGKTYIFNSALKLPLADNVTIIGYGAILKMKANSNADLIVSANYPSTGGGNFVKIIGLTIDGNKSNGNTGSGSTAFYGITNGIMRDVYVHDAAGVGFFLIGANDWRIENCKAYNNGASGFCAYNGCNRVNFVNCVADSNSPNFLLEGLEVDGQAVSTDLNIIGGTARNSLTSQDNVQVFDGVYGFKIVGLTVDGAAAKGINVYSANTAQLTSSHPNKNGLIVDCTIKNSLSGEGIKIWDDGTSGYGAFDLVLTGNRIYDDQGSPTQSYGIALQNQCDKIWITNNDVRNNVSGGIQVGGGVNPNGAVYLNPGDSMILPAALGGTGSGTVTYPLSVVNGGTGQTTYTNGQLLIGNTTGNTLAKAALTGTANQVVVTNGSGSITLSTPQSIDTAAAVTFGSVATSGTITANSQGQLTNNQLQFLNAASVGVIASQRTAANTGVALEFDTYNGSNAATARLTLTGGVTTSVFTIQNTSTVFSALSATTVPYLDSGRTLTSSSVTPTELGYLSGVTSAIQTQLGTKAPLASPTFTGVVTMPTPFTLGAVSVTATGTELNYVAGVTSSIQTQLGTKIDTNGTGLSKSGTTLSLITPVSVANGGTGVGTSTGTGNVVLSASPTLSGTPILSGDAIRGSDAGVTWRTKYHSSIADNGTAVVTNSNQPDCFALVVSDQGYSAGFALRGGFNASVVAFDPSAQFSNTSGTGSKTNVYYSSGNTRYEIENKTGGTRTYSVFYFSQG